ncbi:AraC family transcriptional regulator [Flexithrix dorotheae]|uniref:AraC family transcriptional regulator n=1 Tax=Flexithrix dorotheae TaxID=70993 RepID=UPI0003727C41|nr:AraC family transcriptional regulator [Flexithrix dorotheae]
MIVSRQKFDIGEKCLIEKLIIEPPFVYQAFFEEEACFVYVENGKTHFNAAHERENVNSKESVLLKCGSYFVEWLKFKEAGYCKIYAIHFYPEILKQLYQNEIPEFINQNGVGASRIQKLASHSVIQKFIESLEFYFENPHLVNQELLKLKIKELVLLLIQTQYADSIKALIATMFSPLEVNFKTVIESHLYGPFTIEKLAMLSHLSESSFKRTFKKVYNDTPANYFKKRKLERAAELLKISPLSIGDIAYKVGFQDSAHFSRLFKSHFKISPSEYRTK